MSQATYALKRRCGNRAMPVYEKPPAKLVDTYWPSVYFLLDSKVIFYSIQNVFFTRFEMYFLLD